MKLEIQLVLLQYYLKWLRVYIVVVDDDDDDMTSCVGVPVSKTVTLEKPSWFNLMAHTSPDIPPPMIATVGSRDEDICKTCL